MTATAGMNPKYICIFHNDMNFYKLSLIKTTIDVQLRIISVCVMKRKLNPETNVYIEIKYIDSGANL